MDTNLSRIQKDIETMGLYTATPGAGTTRFTFTKEYEQARDYIKQEFLNAGLSVYEDAIGNIFGRTMPDSKEPVVLIGSHFDSVKNGGGFDGVAGVVMAMEIARVWQEKKLNSRYPIAFAALVEEEGGRFGGGLFASRVLTGQVKAEDLNTLKDAAGISIGETMKGYGFAPEDYAKAVLKREQVKAFLELHIEQGPILESTGTDIGIVDYVVGLTQIVVTIEGAADHAGTTPMHMRKDALYAASVIMAKLPDFAKETGNAAVATVGVLNVLPGAANIVPGKVSLTFDIRSKSEESVRYIYDHVRGLLEEFKTKGYAYQLDEKIFIKPVQLQPEIVNYLQADCEKLGFSCQTMVSGAGHDAMVMAAITDVGLIFVPSRAGKSHCPEEWTDYDQLQKGIEVMYETLKKVAEEKE